MKDKYITSIDISSTSVRLLVVSMDVNGNLHPVHQVSTVVSGVKKGSVVNESELSLSLKRALDMLNRESDVTTHRAIMSPPPAKTHYVSSTVKRNMGHDPVPITDVHLNALLREAKQCHEPLDASLLHVIPVRYHVDGMVEKDPLKMKGTAMALDAITVWADSRTIYLLSQILRDLGIKLEGIVDSAIANAQVVLNSGIETGVLLEIGGRSATISWFNAGKLEGVYRLPVGGDTMTSDIAQVIGTSMPEAEQLKRLYGNIGLNLEEDKTLVVHNLQGEREHIFRSRLCDVLTARVDEVAVLLFNAVPEEFSEMPLYVIGGGSNVPNTIGYLKSLWKGTVSRGLPQAEESKLTEEYVTAFGALHYGRQVNAIKPPESDHDTRPFWKRLFTQA